MFITKGTLYFLLVSLSAIAGFILLGLALVKPKAKRVIPRNAALVLGILLLCVSIYTGIDLTRKTYNKIKTTITALKNFPETVESESNKDTTDYVRILKLYEPEKFKGKVPDAFYTEYGFYDWWRFPLVYPYSIFSMDDMKIGKIVNDSGKTDFDKGGSAKTVSPDFDRLMYDAHYFVGTMDSLSERLGSTEKYFIFDFQNGKVDSFNTKDDLMKKLDEAGFRKEREFVSVLNFSENPFAVLTENIGRQGAQR